MLKRKENYLVFKEYRMGLDGKAEAPDLIRLIYTNGYTLSIGMGEGVHQCHRVFNDISHVELAVIRPDRSFVHIQNGMETAGNIELIKVEAFVGIMESFTDEQEIIHYFDKNGDQPIYA